MIRPMPFCPSLEPWAKETPVQVRISMPRIHHGGGVSPLGALYSARFFTRRRKARRRRAAQTNPIRGDSSNE
ncbi:hypothetical protein D9M69_688450 [compost metagenome]